MQEFIQMAAARLGIEEGPVSAASGSLLRLLGDGGDAGDMQAMLGKLPGAGALMDDAPAAGGGLLGGLGSSLGGGLGAAATALGGLTQSGLSGEQMSSLTSMLVEFAREKAGDDVVGRLLDKVPAVKALLG